MKYKESLRLHGGFAASRPFCGSAAVLPRLRCGFAAVFIFALGLSFAEAEEPPNAELSEYYYRYFPRVLRDDGLEAAERFLLRASDYEAVLSDLSLELARVEDELGRPRAQVIATIEKAISAKRWRRHSESGARLLKARLLNELCDYYAALYELERVGESAERERLALAALLGLRRNSAFRPRAIEALISYPEDQAIQALVFKYAAILQRRSDADISLVEALAKRICANMEAGDVIFEAAKYLSDVESARRILSSHIARKGQPPREALPVLLNLGVYNEETAIENLFYNNKNSAAPVPVELLREVYSLLRNDNSRDYFMDRLLSLNGVLGEDRNKDGIFELLADYEAGMCRRVRIDAAQSRGAPLILNCKAGITLDAEAGGYHLIYDAYPSVIRADSPQASFYFLPDEFFAAPVSFQPLFEIDGILFPERNEEFGVLTERILYASARRVVRPSAEFKGALEELKLLNGVIVKAEEKLAGNLVSETFYRNGTPLYQRADTDLDGRLETIRRFALNSRGELVIEYIEVDNEGFGVYLRE
ncbi:MAG: hypothetical protein LBG79_05035 [Spirochaetaceae bacterium]|nr:hypothetical protein [Spirochaetaceae bacterium]